MQNLVNTYLEKFKQERHVRRRLTCLLLALAMVVSTGVYWQLHLTGAALTNEVYCGLEEHTHTDDCYEEVLVCTQEESEGHTHTDECYETVTTLVCTLEESEGHTHTEECYDADGSLICTLEESEGHTHTDECYETEQVLACEQEESEGHTHTEDCYETQLVCTKEEHTHTIDCMVDETADVETADVWEATLPELTGVWADDVVAIAKSQLGYTESTANFTLDEDGTTRRGYTRYGAWAGNEYGDWDAMFASFCLYYAGISTDDFPEATGAYAWSVTLQGLGLYASAADDTPLPGDLVFLDADEDGKIDRVGIVTAVAEDGALTVIEGNYAEDEDAADAVCETEYAASSAAVVGYGFLPSSDEAASEAEVSSEVAAEESAVEPEESEVEAEESAVEPENTLGLTEQTLTVTEGDATITLSGLLPEGATVTAEPVDVEIEGKTVLMAFNISIYYADGSEFEPEDDTISVTIQSDEIGGGNSVYYVPEEGDAEKMASEAADGAVVFDAEHFSTYAVTEGEGETATVSLAATNVTGYPELDSTYYEVSWKDVTYSNGELTGTLYLNLLGAVNDNQQYTFDKYGYTYVFYLDMFEDVDLTTEQVTVYASDGSTVAYTYEILQDSNGEYYAIIYFNESFIKSGNEITSLYFWVNGTVDSDAWGTDENNNNQVYITVDGVNIPITEITYTDESKTMNSDVDVSKTGSYDDKTSTLYYTITVTTEKGTDGKITLDDYFYQQIADGVDINNSTGYVIVTITKHTSSGDEVTTKTVYYSYYTDSSGKNTMSFELDELDALEAGESYEITYALSVDIASGGSLNINEAINNTVSVTTEGSSNTELKDEDENKTDVTVDLLSKSGTKNSDGTITWTITVNNSQANIATFYLVDEKFANADANGIIVSPSEGYSIDGNTITFNATDSDGDGDSSTNRNTYTITYTTASNQTLGNSTVTNEAELHGNGGSSGTSATIPVDGGKLAKECTDAVKDTSTNTATLNWTSTVTVPAGGIAAGTTIYDYLPDEWYYTSGTSSTHQWYTCEQISKLFEALSNGITLSDGTTIDGSSLTLKAYSVTSGIWVDSGNLTGYSSDYFTAWSITFGDAVSLKSGSTSATFTLSYSSTADTSVIDGSNVTSYEYKNQIAVGSLDAYASKTLTNYKTVVKTNGSGKSDDTSVTITSENDNTLTWIVKAYIDAGTSYQSITVTDTLPSGVELSSITVSGGITATVTYENDAWTSNSAYVTADVSGQTVTLTISEELYESLETSGGYVYITYTCKISDSVIDGLMDGTYASYSFNNSASVQYTKEDGTDGPSGSDEQEQTVTYEEPQQSYLDKSYYWDNANDRMTYYVLVNPTEEDLLEDGDELTFTDTLKSYANDSYGVYANLIYTTVTFYELTPLTGTWSGVSTATNRYQNASGQEVVDTYIVSGTFVAEDGTRYTYRAGSTANKIYVTNLTDATDVNSATVYLKTAVDIAWTYSETTGSSGYETLHTITATVQDETRYLVEYAYQITNVATSGNLVSIENEATLTGSASDKVDNTSYDDYTEVNSGGGASYHNGFILTKVDSTTYSKTLAGAEYALWAYDNTAGDFVDTNVRITTDYSGSFSLSLTEDNGTLVSTITDADGTTEYTDKEWFTYNTLYYVVETAAPDGYLLDNTTKYYFYWSNSDTTTYPSTYPSDWTSYSTAYSPQYDLTATSHSIAAPNTAASTTSIGVQKVWQDESGNVVTDTTTDPDTVEVELYRYTTAPDSSASSSSSSSGDEVTVWWNADGGGYQSVGTVPKGEAATFTFTFKENATGSWYIGVGGGYWDYGIAYSAYGTSSTGTITADNVTDDIYIYTNNVADVSLPVTYGTLTVTKDFADDTLTDKSNVKFTVTDSDGNTVQTFSYSDMTSGSITFDSFATGTYTITESGADVSGYTRTTTWDVDGKEFTGTFCNIVTVTKGDTTTVKVTNSYTEGTSVVGPSNSDSLGTYTISASDDWSLLISGLPATDSTGNTYYYYIKEVSKEVSGSGYTLVSYSDSNSGINQGTITVTNKLTEEEEEYTLPSAGGVGVWPYALAGLALCGGAVWLLRRRWLAED